MVSADLSDITDEFLPLRKHMPPVLQVDAFKENDKRNRYRDVLCAWRVDCRRRRTQASTRRGLF